jgi:hypothetical protein
MAPLGERAKTTKGINKNKKLEGWGSERRGKVNQQSFAIPSLLPFFAPRLLLASLSLASLVKSIFINFVI